MALLGDLLNPEVLIERGGLALLALIVFAESGLLVGFFLPGDSLLFIAGFMTSASDHLPPIGVVVVTVVVAAIAGDQVGYIFGRRVGASLAMRPRTRLFDPRNVARAEDFFARHGPKTIVLARFVPIVRTFAPIVAGISSMRYRTFVTYNVIGGILWGGGLTLAGYFLGDIEVVRENIEIAAVLIVALSLVPMAIEIWRHRRRSRAESIDRIDAAQP